MRMRKFTVTGLFDTFDHEVAFNLDEGITLMLGENGMGKTVMLRMIKALFEKDFLFLFGTPFEQVQIEFENGSLWRVRKRSEEEEEEVISIFLVNAKNIQQGSIEVSSKELLTILKELNNRRVIRHIESEFEIFFHSDLSSSGDNKSWSQLLELLKTERSGLHPMLERARRKLKRTFQQLPDWYRTWVEELPIFLIETQRLILLSDDEPSPFEREGHRYQETVLAHAQDLKHEIQSKIAQSAELATQLDQSFPLRLTQLSQGSNPADEIAIERRLAELKEKRNFLRGLGLYQGQQEDSMLQGANTDFMKPVMQVYAEDNHKKLAVFDELAAKIDLFQRIINSRFLYKGVKVSKEEGFAFYSTLNQKEIPLSALSSGEQHELVLFYQLLCNIQPNSLILIDEPEISLHVSWQNHFIDDLKEVIKLNPIDILIATHSPSIVGSHWNLTVELKGINQEAIV